MNHKIKYVFVALCLMIAVNLSANSNALLWNSANDAYSMGQYETALNDYLKIEENGVHSYKLYYNIGKRSAYLQNTIQIALHQTMTVCRL